MGAFPLSDRLACAVRLGVAVLAAGMLAACAPPAAGDHIIYLSDLEPLPPPPSEDVVPLRVAVAAVISPTGTLESYQPLLDYISDETGRPVELIQRRTYAEINDLIKRGEVDVAFVCTSAYVEGHRDFGMELLAAPQVNGAPVYYSLLIVPADSPAQNMVDLRGSVFAFTDPMSTTGRVYPTYLVEQLGSTPAAFFSRTFFTYSHDDAIRAVASGVADGAAVDSLVYEAAIQRDPSLTERVRIIQRSPPFAAPPVVVNPALRPRLRAEIQALLFDLPYSPEGREILDALGVERFVPISDSAYDPVRELIDAVTPLAQAGE